MKARSTLNRPIEYQRTSLHRVNRNARSNPNRRISDRWPHRYLLPSPELGDGAMPQPQLRRSEAPKPPQARDYHPKRATWCGGQGELVNGGFSVGEVLGFGQGSQCYAAPRQRPGSGHKLLARGALLSTTLDAKSRGGEGKGCEGILTGG
jgi:hypothetical protein